jgi:hypothetical protein
MFNFRNCLDFLEPFLKSHEKLEKKLNQPSKWALPSSCSERRHLVPILIFFLKSRKEKLEFPQFFLGDEGSLDVVSLLVGWSTRWLSTLVADVSGTLFWGLGLVDAGFFTFVGAFQVYFSHSRRGSSLRHWWEIS